jgi:hypothetical protein
MLTEISRWQARAAPCWSTAPVGMSPLSCWLWPAACVACMPAKSMHTTTRLHGPSSSLAPSHLARIRWPAVRSAHYQRALIAPVLTLLLNLSRLLARALCAGLLCDIACGWLVQGVVLGTACRAYSPASAALWTVVLRLVLLTRLNYSVGGARVLAVPLVCQPLCCAPGACQCWAPGPCELLLSCRPLGHALYVYTLQAGHRTEPLQAFKAAAACWLCADASTV